MLKSKQILFIVLPAMLCMGLGVQARADAAPLSVPKMVGLLKGIDDRIRSAGDYQALVYLESRERDRPDTAQEALVYRRDTDNELMILFTKPKSSAGTGYLRIDNNLWY